MRGPGTTEENAQVLEPVRVCAECHRAKTIRGVWYLVPAAGPGPFVCETCFGHGGQARALI